MSIVRFLVKGVIWQEMIVMLCARCDGVYEGPQVACQGSAESHGRSCPAAWSDGAWDQPDREHGHQRLEHET